MAAPTRNNQVNSRSTTNATSVTLSSYTPTSGSDRVLVVRAAAMYGVASSFTLSATFGGVSMTEAATEVATWTDRYLRVSIFYLINPSGSAGDIVVTASQTMNGFTVDAVTLLGAAQSSVVGSTDTDTGTSTDTSTLALTGCAAESLVLAAVASNCALAPTWSWSGATEDYELTGTASTAEMAGAGAYYTTASSGTVNITATRSDSTPGLVAAAVEFKKPAASNQTLTGATIASGATLYAPAKVSHKLTGATIASGATVHTPAMVAKAVAPPVIASTATLYAPAKINQQIVMAAIASGAALYAPSSVTIAGATTTLTGAHIASTAALYAPSKVNQGITAPLIASTAALYGGMVHRGLIRIDNVAIVTSTDVSSNSFTHTVNVDGAILIIAVAQMGASLTPTVEINNPLLDWDYVFSTQGVIGQSITLTFCAFSVNSGDWDISVVDVGPQPRAIYTISLSGHRGPAVGDIYTIYTDIDESDTIDVVPLFSNSLIIALGAGDTAGNIGEPTITAGASFLYQTTRDDAIRFYSGLTLLGAAATGTYSNVGPTFEDMASAVSFALVIPELRSLLGLPAWATSTTLYAPARVALPGQTLDGAAIASGAALYAPAMVTKVMAGATIASTAAVSTPLKVNHKLGGATFASGARYAPSVTVGAHALAGAHIGSVAALYAGAIAPGGVTLAGETIAGGLTVYAPAAAVPGGVTLRARMVDIGTQVYAPARVVNYRYLAPPLIESTAVVNAPAAMTLRTYIYAPFIGCETPIGINSPAMVNLMTLYAMTMLRLRIYGAAIAPLVSVYSPATVTTTDRTQTGDVYPPVEVDVI